MVKCSGTRVTVAKNQRSIAHAGTWKTTLTAGLVSFMLACGGLQSRPATGPLTMRVNHTLNHATAIKEYRENGVCVLRNFYGDSIHGDLFPLIWERGNE